MKKVDVRETKNKGKGVFTSEDIKKSEHILDINDSLII